MGSRDAQLRELVEVWREASKLCTEQGEREHDPEVISMGGVYETCLEELEQLLSDPEPA